MGYCGAVPSEDSSGKRTRRGGITKTGNAHLRRIVVEAAWSYRRPPYIWYGLHRRQESISEEAKEIAWQAQLCILSLALSAAFPKPSLLDSSAQTFARSVEQGLLRQTVNF
jgi:hypothetical protein